MYSFLLCKYEIMIWVFIARQVLLISIFNNILTETEHMLYAVNLVQCFCTKRGPAFQIKESLIPLISRQQAGQRQRE